MPGEDPGVASWGCRVRPPLPRLSPRSPRPPVSKLSRSSPEPPRMCGSAGHIQTQAWLQEAQDSLSIREPSRHGKGHGPTGTGREGAQDRKEASLGGRAGGWGPPPPCPTTGCPSILLWTQVDTEGPSGLTLLQSSSQGGRWPLSPWQRPSVFLLIAPLAACHFCLFCRREKNPASPRGSWRLQGQQGGRWAWLIWRGPSALSCTSCPGGSLSTTPQPSAVSLPGSRALRGAFPLWKPPEHLSSVDICSRRRRALLAEFEQLSPWSPAGNGASGSS